MAGRGVNKVILVGNIGKDPETRYMPNGDAVTNITLATSESWKDKNTGEQKELTEWHRVTFYRKLAEIVAEYVKKGSKLYVEGALRTRSWEQDGVKRYATEIIASEMQMLDGKGGGGSSDADSGGSYQPAPRSNSGSSGGSSGGGAQRSQKSPPPEVDSFDDDIPF